MKRFLALALAAVLLAPAALMAHGPSRQKVVKEVQINAPPAEVWVLIQDFCSISAWNPAVPECNAAPGNALETVRTTTLKNGKSLKEKLVGYDPAAMTMQYLLVEPNPEALPVNTLGTTLSVRGTEGGGSIVEWKTAFYRSFPGPTPPPELSDAAATAAVTGIIDAGFTRLKELAEK